MPLIYSTSLPPSARMAVWKIEETEHELLQQLRLLPQDYDAILSLRLEKRRKERIACRRALAFLLGTPEVEITYAASGKPLCEAGQISFSHSGNYAAAALSPSNPIGIDIEKISPSISKLYPKFISDRELENIDITDYKSITRVWCAKEALYKFFGEGNLDFLNDMIVERRTGSIISPHFAPSHPIPLFEWEDEGMMGVVAHGGERKNLE